MTTGLPIDDLLPRLIDTLNSSTSVVIQAPPGAGKTTRVPLALLNAPFLGPRKIIMLEPRRLAAVNAARWMATSLGEKPGATVGYSIRFERNVSAATRIEVVTEGILTRRLQHDPALEGVGVIIFDEFHERSLNSDLALALALDARDGLREDLRIIVMSATLDAAPIARLLGECPVLTSKGRSFPVEVRYRPEDDRDPARATAAGVRTALRETEGDILAFLPGGAEIRRCRRLLEEKPALEPQVMICALYGDLPFAEQERAIVPADRRKVVLATNIAETSLTIQGVRIVVDAGFARQLQFDPATGLDRLVTVRVSAASAAQRTGRAGRLAPGTCYRLWTEFTQETLVPFSPPEIRTADLTPLALELALWGVSEAAALRWLDAPPAASLAEGRRLLAMLGALDRSGTITRHGKDMARLPLHPRLSHMLLTAEADGLAPRACDLAALLSERDILRYGPLSGNTWTTDSDVADRVEALDQWRTRRTASFAAGEADAQACGTVDRISRHLERLLAVGGKRGGEISSREIATLVARAYPDRIARRREQGSDRYVLANGRGGSLSPRSGVRGREFIIAVVMEGGERGDGLIHMAAGISLEQIRQEFSPVIVRQRIVAWEKGEQRVVARQEERLGSLALSASPVVPTAEELHAALMQGLVDAGLAALNWTAQSSQFLARARFVAGCEQGKGWPDLSESTLAAALPEWLGPWLAGVRSLGGLGRIDLLFPLKGLFTRDQLQRIDEWAPTHLSVPSGSRLPLSYDGDAPVLEVKLQELFGLAETPTVAGGQVPVVLHLLSPARRPVQVTRDLRGFWEGTYREVRKELKGRYPRHPWPEDPWAATPTRHAKARSRQ